MADAFKPSWKGDSMAIINLQPFLDAVQAKLLTIRARKKRYTLSTDVLNENLSIEYSTIPMSKPAKHVIIYYSGECVYAYKKLICLYQKCRDLRMMQLDQVGSMISTYVNGWAAGKEITWQNIDTLKKMINVREEAIKKAIHDYDELRAQFDALNVHDDTEMVDSSELSLYQTVKEFPYRKAYKHFFKRDHVSDKLIEEHIKEDNEFLEEMIRLMSVLYMGWNKVGKGDAYEKYRLRQRDLIYIVDKFADVISLDLDLYERFASLNNTVVAFKVYPYEPSED